MISITAAKGEMLCVFVSPEESPEVKAILNGLLGTKMNPKTGLYYIPVYDFPIFKEKLNRLGLTTSREMDDAAWEKIRDYEYRLNLNEDIKAGKYNHEILAMLSGGELRSTPWPDQVSDIRFLLREIKAGVFNEMGVGKTMGLLSTFVLLRAARMARYALVVAPNAVKQNWLKQTAQHTKMTACELGNGKGQTLRRLRDYEQGRTDLCITHYEALRDDTFREALVKLPFDMVICDEAHLMKNAGSKRSKALLDTMDKVRPAVDLVEADVQLADGTIISAVFPAGVKPNDIVDFF